MCSWTFSIDNNHVARRKNSSEAFRLPASVHACTRHSSARVTRDTADTRSFRRLLKPCHLSPHSHDSLWRCAARQKSQNTSSGVSCFFEVRLLPQESQAPSSWSSAAPTVVGTPQHVFLVPCFTNELLTRGPWQMSSCSSISVYRWAN